MDGYIYPFFLIVRLSAVRFQSSIMTFGRVCFRSGKLKHFEFFELRRDSA